MVIALARHFRLTDQEEEGGKKKKKKRIIHRVLKEVIGKLLLTPDRPEEGQKVNENEITPSPLWNMPYWASPLYKRGLFTGGRPCRRENKRDPEGRLKQAERKRRKEKPVTVAREFEGLARCLVVWGQGHYAPS